MAYILTAQRHQENHGAAASAFDRYRAYLASVRGRFPRGALELATSDWYFNSSDRRSPHDAWLERVSISRLGSGDRGERREVTVAIRLLGANHDAYIEFHYRDVVRYRIELGPGGASGGGHRDWRYDEFRLGPTGGLVHEIEWWGREATGTWLIEAADVEYRWQPLAEGKAAASVPDA
jgi:hypothetical protein